MSKFKAQVIVLLLSLTAAQAQTVAPVSASALIDVLDTLRGKGVLSQQEFETLKQRILGSQPVATTPAPAAPAQQQAAETLDKSKMVTMMDKGIGVHVGAVDVSVSGEINGFYDFDRPAHVTAATSVAGGIASTGSNSSSAVRNGLLPGNFSISINTKQSDYDIGVVFGFYPGLNSVSGTGGANSAGSPSGFGSSGIDFRQQYITVAKSNMGTFKVGRDIGFFAEEGVLNDMTLLGVGSTGGGNIAPSNTSFGRIGLGYIYCDFIPQISYTTPTFAGLQFSAGIFTPLNTVNFSGHSGILSAHNQPQFQTKLTYNLPEKHAVRLGLWTNLITQHLVSNSTADALPVGTGVQGTGIDYGAKIGHGGADFVAYGYQGWGLGSAGLFFDAVSATGVKRGSYGYYLQGTYTIAKRLTLGASYGLSHLDAVGAETQSSLFKSNSSEVGGLRYKLTDWMALVTEYTHTNSQAYNGNSTSSDSIAAGSILFFGH